MHKLTIIEFPSNLGLKEPAFGKEPGVKNLPAWLRRHCLHEQLQPDQILNLPAPAYCAVPDPATGVLNLAALAEYAEAQATLLRPVLALKELVVVIGGDCSILLGSALALKQLGSYALFYLDGHTDFMEPKLSATGGAGGMAAALVAGYGPSQLTQLNQLGPYIPAAHVWCVGNREYDEDYERAIQDSRATYVSLRALREAGIAKTAYFFLEMVEVQNLDGFWLHLDVDVLDDTLMPAVDSRTPGGLTYPECNTLLTLLLESPKIAGLEITILDPDLDPTGHYTQEFVSNLVAVFQKARKKYEGLNGNDKLFS